MDTESRKRLTSLFYSLTRDHLAWGTLHKVIDEHVRKCDGEHVYCSDAGRALAATAVDRLLGPMQPVGVDVEPGGHLVVVVDGLRLGAHVLVSLHTTACALRWSGNNYTTGMAIDHFMNGDFVLLPATAELTTEKSPSTPARTVSESDWSKLCAAVGLIEDVNVGAIVQVIAERQTEEHEAIATLAAYCSEADPGKLSLRGVVSLLESEVLSRPEPNSSTPCRAGVAVTVDTAVCSFDDALQHAIALAQTHARVRFHHGRTTVDVSPIDTQATLRDSWQREADHAATQRQRRRNDGRSRIAHDLRDAGFTSASWSDDLSTGAAVTLSNEDATALLTSDVRLREGKVTTRAWVEVDDDQAEPNTPAALVRRAVLAVTGVTAVDVDLDTSKDGAWDAHVTVTGGDNSEVARAIASVLPVWFGTKGAVRIQVPIGNEGHDYTNIAFDRHVQPVLAVGMPDADTLRSYVKNSTPVRITFVGGERMLDLPKSGVLERVVFAEARTEFDGLVLTTSQPACAPYSFWTAVRGGYHPQLTSVEPLPADS